jgi:ADP-heptose:LPS heptosyltransferase
MRLLVIRTSAMGDVALTAPVVKAMRTTYPDIEIVLLTREAFRPFFRQVRGLSLFHPDLKNRHSGIIGIFMLFRDIKAEGNIDYVIDLHDVLRSKILRFFFRLSGVKIAVINKGKGEKRSVIKGRIRTKLKHSVERYCDVFAAAGFPVNPGNGPWIIPSLQAGAEASLMTLTPGVLNIGVAPYAKHKLKMWPEENMARLLKMISSKHKTRFWLFAGKEEKEKLTVLQSDVPDSVIVAGNFSLDEELAIMSRLDFMIAMDSSNMHMAALVGTKTISIWGGTDPLTGFGAWGQPEEHFIGIPHDELDCRPCTIFGKGECRRGDHACMNWLTPERVFEKFENLPAVQAGLVI